MQSRVIASNFVKLSIMRTECSVCVFFFFLCLLLCIHGEVGFYTRTNRSHSSAAITHHQMYAESTEGINFIFQTQNVQNVLFQMTVGGQIITNAFLSIRQ